MLILPLGLVAYTLFIQNVLFTLLLQCCNYSDTITFSSPREAGSTPMFQCFTTHPWKL